MKKLLFLLCTLGLMGVAQAMNVDSHQIKADVNGGRWLSVIDSVAEGRVTPADILQYDAVVLKQLYSNGYRDDGCYEGKSLFQLLLYKSWIKYGDEKKRLQEFLEQLIVSGKVTHNEQLALSADPHPSNNNEDREEDAQTLNTIYDEALQRVEKTKSEIQKFVSTKNYKDLVLYMCQSNVDAAYLSFFSAGEKNLLLQQIKSLKRIWGAVVSSEIKEHLAEIQVRLEQMRDTDEQDESDDSYGLSEDEVPVDPYKLKRFFRGDGMYFLIGCGVLITAAASLIVYVYRYSKAQKAEDDTEQDDETVVSDKAA